MKNSKAYIEGQEAVRQKPFYAPKNPYDNLDSVEHEDWENGAIDAGICEIYTNGKLGNRTRKSE